MYKWVLLKSGRPDEMLGDILAVDKHPILGAIGIVIVALCHGNQDKLQPHGPLSSSTDLIVLHTSKLCP